VGDGSVGKTSMVFQYSERNFQERYIMTIGSNFAIKSLVLDDTKIKIQIWDLAGQKHFSFVRPPFYRGSSGTLYVFDLTRRQSFDNLLNWKEEVETVIKKPFILIGNKNDLHEDRLITEEEAVSFAKEMGALKYYETSAKTGENLDLAFLTLVKKILNKD
jgi:small GTP-binding protein